MRPFNESTSSLSDPSSEPRPSSSGQFHCRTCKRTFKIKDGAVQHNENQCHPPSRNEKQAESRRRRLAITVKDHRGEVFTLNRVDENSKFSCPVNCGTAFARGDVMSRHLLTCGVDNPSRFLCHNCGTTFARRDVMRRHLEKSCKGDSGTSNTHQIDLQVQQKSDDHPQESSASKTISQPDHNVAGVSEIFTEWDKLKGGPTWAAGRKALTNWLRRPYPSLRVSARMTTENPVQGDILEWKHILADITVAARSGGDAKLRLWNCATNSTDLTTARHDLTANLISTPSAETCPRTAFFGAKEDTDGGALASCKLKVPSASVEEGVEIRFAVEKMETDGKRPREEGSRRSTRLKESGAHDTQDIACDNWVVVVSNAGAISGFHIDNHGSGAFIHVAVGVKVLASCPCTTKNWELFRQHYLKNDPKDRCSI